MFGVNAGQDFQQCLVDAVAEVLLTTAGVSVCLTADEVSAPGAGVELTGVILIQGQRSVLLSLKMSKNYAATLIAAMTGLDSFALSDEELYDGVAEIVNMIAGRIKLHIEAADSSGYSLTQPFTIVGENVSVIYKEQVPQKISLTFEAEEAKLYLVLTLL